MGAVNKTLESIKSGLVINSINVILFEKVEKRKIIIENIKNKTNDVIYLSILKSKFILYNKNVIKHDINTQITKTITFLI